MHHGRVAVTAPDGALTRELGAVFAPMYPRSSSKPMQAVGMVRAGLDLPPDLLALVCASHSGEPFHVAGVRRILDRAGLTEADLQTRRTGRSTCRPRTTSSGPAATRR